MPVESIQMKNSNIGLCHVLSWPKKHLELKFHDAGTFGGSGKADIHTHTRFMFYNTHFTLCR